MATAKAISAAESDCRRLEQLAIKARNMLAKASVRDGRLMAMLPSRDPKRVAFEKASSEAMAAERQAQEARAKLERLRSANGGGSKPSVKQARMALEAAIIGEKRARAAAEKNRTAIDNSYTQSAAARRKLEAAERDVEKAPEDDAEAAAKAVAAGRSPPAPTLAKVKAKVADAESAVEAIRTGRQRLEERQQQLEVAVANAKRQVEDAANAVLKAECPVERLVAEACKLTEPLVAVRIKLRHWHAFATGAEREQIEMVLRERMPGTPAEYYGEHPTSNAITAARTALMADATAEVDLEI
jgi:hypothetical protein